VDEPAQRSRRRTIELCSAVEARILAGCANTVREAGYLDVVAFNQTSEPFRFVLTLFDRESTGVRDEARVYDGARGSARREHSAGPRRQDPAARDP
jgi:hypothetical protein